MNKEQLHGFISCSDGNESNICQIYVTKEGETLYDACWHGFKTLDAMNVNSVTKGVIENAAGMKCIDFANENLFRPLGLPDRIPHGDSSKEDQFDFFMNKNPRRYEWYTDPQDSVTAG